MNGNSMTDTMLVEWVNHQITLRKALAQSCVVNGTELAYDDEAGNRLLIYSRELFERVAELFGGTIKSKVVDSTDCYRNYRLNFHIGDVEVLTYDTRGL